MKRSVHLVLAALVFAGLATPCVAQPPTGSHMHGRWHHDHPFMHVLHQLNLTTDQKTKIHAIYDEARPQMESLGMSTRSNMEQLMTTPPGDAAYTALMDNAKANALAHLKLIGDIQAQIYAVLTPEQQANIPGIVTAEKAKRDAARRQWRAAHEQPASK